MLGVAFLVEVFTGAQAHVTFCHNWFLAAITAHGNKPFKILLANWFFRVIRNEEL